MTSVVVVFPSGERLAVELTGDDVLTLEVDGMELVGVFGDSGAGWWPAGDGGETNGDWTPLLPNPLPAR